MKFLIFLLLAGTLHATRYHQYTDKFQNPSDKAEVLTASFFGGSGNEWLTAGAFLEDGSVIVAGNFIGPDFDIKGSQIHVLGRDGKRPGKFELFPEKDKYKKTIKKNKDGSTRYLPPTWKDENATGFIAHLSADLQEIKSISRVPWRSAVLTDIKVKGNEIFLCGKAGDAFSSISGRSKTYKASDNEMKSGACDHTFIASISADLKKIVWQNDFKGFSNAPKLSISKKGEIIFKGPDIRYFDSKGKLLNQVTVPGGLGHLVAVNPNDGTYVRGGEHHWKTGREPWRCPKLNVFNPDGSLLYHLYDWGGPYVGLDNCRLVSDTAIRRVEFAPDGDLLIYAWSDGGNSVALREPMDVRKFSPQINGLGFSAWGAGVLSCAYIIKIDTETYRATGGTVWLAYLESKEKPNSAWIDSLSHADDGSVCFAGRTASSLITTGNALSEAKSGQNIVILRNDLSSIRFSTAIPGGGAVMIGNDKESWGTCSGIIKGKQRVLYLCGAQNGENDFKTPLHKAAQNEFGGGYSDGYMVLLEMDAAKKSVTKISKTTSDKSSGRSGEKIATLNDFESKKRTPKPGQSFSFSESKPKWVTVDAEFRSEDESVWPSFFYGKPESGSFTFNLPSPSASIELNCKNVCQNAGDQSRRIMGEFVKEKSDTKLSFKIHSMGPYKTYQESYTDKGKSKKRSLTVAQVKAEMILNGKKYEIQGEAFTKFSYGKKSENPESVQIDIKFLIDAEKLGLKNHKGLIKGRVSCVGYSD